MIGMSARDEDNDLIVVVSYLLKRQVRMQEALSALGMSRSTYYEQRDKGVLNSIPNLMAVARLSVALRLSSSTALSNRTGAERRKRC
ncbi:immunity repressor [Mycobacterium phage Itos]|nr:immunity repressor [Mycobacterium phage Itos]